MMAGYDQRQFDEMETNINSTSGDAKSYIHPPSPESLQMFIFRGDLVKNARLVISRTEEKSPWGT